MLANTHTSIHQSCDNPIPVPNNCTGPDWASPSDTKRDTAQMANPKSTGAPISTLSVTALLSLFCPSLAITDVFWKEVFNKKGESKGKNVTLKR